MKQGTTIQINSLEALERLLGGNTELEVSLRQSVAAAMAEKHLKTVLKDPGYLQIVQSLQNDLRNQFLNIVQKDIGEVKRSYGGAYSVTIQPEIVERIKFESRNTAWELIKKTVEEAITTMDIKAHVKQHVDNLVMNELKEVFNAKMAKALAAAV